MNKFRILWVEDDAKDLDDMVGPLRTDGSTIDIALTYESAKEKILKTHQPYDIVILDIIIPSGYNEVKELDELKRIENTYYGIKLLEFISENQKTPVFVFSVINDYAIIEKVKSYNIVRQVLQKGPIEPTELKDKVYAAIRGLKK